MIFVFPENLLPPLYLKGALDEPFATEEAN